jgi:hypothetical protein
MSLSAKRNAELNHRRRKTLLPTDITFEDANPGYYTYSRDTYERKCLHCGKWFETNLEFNRFCCHKHMQKSLGEA